MNPKRIWWNGTWITVPPHVLRSGRRYRIARRIVYGLVLTVLLPVVAPVFALQVVAYVLARVGEMLEVVATALAAGVARFAESITDTAFRPDRFERKWSSEFDALAAAEHRATTLSDADAAAAGGAGG